MATTKTSNQGYSEEHVDDTKAPSITKGTFMQVGSYVPMGATVSVNVKTGKGPSGEPGS